MTQVRVVVSRSLEKSVLAICALLLPVSRDGGPHPTQHAAPETSTHTHSVAGGDLFEGSRTNEAGGQFCFVHFCTDRWHDE